MRQDMRWYCKTCNIVFTHDDDKEIDGAIKAGEHAGHELTVVEMNKLLPEDEK